LGNTTKILQNMDENPQQKIPIKHGDISIISEKTKVKYMTVWRWYNEPPKKRIEEHGVLMEALLNLYEERKREDDTAEKRIKYLGL
jgi:hypothetical protein